MIALYKGTRAYHATHVRVDKIRIPSRDSNRTIPAYMYTPTDVQGPLPVHLNWHASGFSAYISNIYLHSAETIGD